MNFYSEDVLQGVTKMVVEDGAGRWAGAAAYAHTYLHAAESRDVAFVVESDQSVVVWLNGTRLPERGGGRFPTRLDTGWNRLLVKVLSPSSTRGVQPVYPTAGQPGNWTLRAGISLPGGGPVPQLRVQCEDPERNSPRAGEAAVPVRYLTALRGPGDRRPLFVRGEPTDLTLTIRAAAGAYEHFPVNPQDRYDGEAWTYAAPPGPATTSADSGVSLDELQKVAARQVAVVLSDFDGNRVFADRFPLAFRESAKGDLVCTVSLYRGSLPVGHYSLTTDFIDADGRVQARRVIEWGEWGHPVCFTMSVFQVPSRMALALAALARASRFPPPPGWQASPAERVPSCETELGIHQKVCWFWSPPGSAAPCQIARGGMPDDRSRFWCLTRS